MNKKALILLIMTISLLTIGAGCVKQDTKNQAGIGGNTLYSYESTKYGFSLAFPANWGTVKEETKAATIFNTVLLTAENDPNRYIQISVVKVGDKNKPLVVDYPHSYLTENETYAYYYSGGGDDAGKPGLEDQKYFDIAKEVKTISETFKLTTFTGSLADCRSLSPSWALFSDSETSLSFCYINSWGTAKFKETEISPAAKAGTIYYISFSESVNYPLISYSTLDFKKLGDSDVPSVIDWKALDFSKSETELALLFPNEKATVRKITVNSKQVLVVNRDFIEPLSQKRITPLDYFMPNVSINGTTYNLHLVGLSEQEAVLDKLLESMSY
ncbi:MAG: hypothetical protein UT33_C0017G0011 [Candidatus Peregrinibacteria bacterium GW2011_GWC2_39_14]|nr:MAG: hypothetical protein US92_C0007G0042 [Candidatus Peregrinibacteria bacterium GW2011_GWA2_38_36]KKR04740.1 MAG: hypothetical protein UT33_C0017G0011 [Candidatus Peregrinibacteria bacterium GW2011_GWC2_39_14]